jgi:hypothetical protein
MKENWKYIGGFTGQYQISDTGNIRSVDRVVNQLGHKNKYSRIMKGKDIKQRLQNGGYLLVWLSKEGKVKPFTVHRLVATTFIPNPNKLRDVNHLDGNKCNNNISNLEWCTRSENIKHSYAQLNRLRHNETAVLCIELNKSFESIKKASTEMKINKGSIGHVLRGRNKTP